MVQWNDTQRRRGYRDRQADLPVPGRLPPRLDKEQIALLHRWVRSDAIRRKREVLLTAVGPSEIERAEMLCELLLREGWIVRHERLAGGSWTWDAISWRDLPRLQALLGVSGKRQRTETRQMDVARAEKWLRERGQVAAGPTLDPDLQDELEQALAQLRDDNTLRPDLLAVRLNLLRAIAAWHDAGGQGSRRDFALQAGGTTKALSAATWRWLEASFDLERLRIARFTPVAWLAGDCVLSWGERSVELMPLHCVGLPLSDLSETTRVATPVRWWLIENRASFERQARLREPGVILVWLPGRPSSIWLATIAHLLALAPAPAWISADADPAGVDIACTAGALWNTRGLHWEPYRMGAAQLAATSQHWPLNEHDRTLLASLLGRDNLPPALRELCEAMKSSGQKAEQEEWL